MGTPFMGELKIVGFNFPPKGWAECNGQFLPINQNQALFSLLGTMYGGNGQTTFALPDLRGRVPIHMGAGFTEGQAGGQEAHTITISEMPAHNHIVSGTSATGNLNNGNGAAFGLSQAPIYHPFAGAAVTTLSPTSVTNAGGSQPHENRQPFLVLNYVIALQGVFPSHN
jgi:microcystin-dependent protein